jgi:alpha-amylase
VAEGLGAHRPVCTYKDAKTFIECTLVKNLPDFLTESDTPVELPERLMAKWQREGRFEEEVRA